MTISASTIVSGSVLVPVFLHFMVFNEDLYPDKNSRELCRIWISLLWNLIDKFDGCNRAEDFGS